MTTLSANLNPGALMRIEVAYSPAPRVVELCVVQLPSGATVWQALQASGLDQRVPGPQETQASTATASCAAIAGHLWCGLSLAVLGRRLTLGSELFDGDRLDCCRPLRVDPKLARRERFNQQGSRRSGLFAKRREGAVAGY